MRLKILVTFFALLLASPAILQSFAKQTKKQSAPSQIQRRYCVKTSVKCALCPRNLLYWIKKKVIPALTLDLVAVFKMKKDKVAKFEGLPKSSYQPKGKASCSSADTIMEINVSFVYKDKCDFDEQVSNCQRYTVYHLHYWVEISFTLPSDLSLPAGTARKIEAAKFGATACHDVHRKTAKCLRDLRKPFPHRPFWGEKALTKELFLDMARRAFKPLFTYLVWRMKPEMMCLVDDDCDCDSKCEHGGCIKLHVAAMCMDDYECHSNLCKSVK